MCRISVLRKPSSSYHRGKHLHCCCLTQGQYTVLYNTAQRAHLMSTTSPQATETRFSAFEGGQWDSASQI